MTGWNLCAERRCFALDIENLAMGSRLVAEQMSRVRGRVQALLIPTPGDHVVIAAGPNALVDAGLAWPGARLRLGRGLDGADHQILALEDEDLTTRYAELVLGSGDAIFTPMVRRLRQQGLVVTVMAASCHLSRRLAAEASRVVLFDDPRPMSPVAVAA